MANRLARRDGAVPPAALVAALREREHTVWKPPGGGIVAGLVHDVIHGEDITVALGIDHRISEETVRIVLDSVAGPKSRKHFGVDLEGTRLVANDIDWSSGSGELLSGSAQDLALVLCGRKLPDGRLQGKAGVRFTVGTPAKPL